MTPCMHCGRRPDTHDETHETHPYAASPERIGEYLSVRMRPAEPGRRTHRWAVLTNHGDELGVIQWFPRWRQYCFDPREMTTFNAGCLRDLMTFLERVNKEHRARAGGDLAARPASG